MADDPSLDTETSEFEELGQEVERIKREVAERLSRPCQSNQTISTEKELGDAGSQRRIHPGGCRSRAEHALALSVGLVAALAARRLGRSACCTVCDL